MKPTDYLKERNIVAEDKADLIIGFNDGSEVSLIELMESYHQDKLKLLGIAHVVGRSEQCSGCEESTGETKLWCCNHCGKRIEDW